MAELSVNNVLALRQAILQRNSALQEANSATAGSGIGGAAGGVGGATDAPGAPFANALKSALDQVSSLQSESSAASAAFERGETTDIAAVMLARQQSSIAFEATLQVRNKLLSAYKDIMSMPV